MIRKILSYFCFILIANSVIVGQYSRTKSMGNLSFSLNDKNQTLNLYDFGNNPAWLMVDEKGDLLEISPSYSNEWGNFRNAFSSEGTTNYGAGFIGIKPLGDNGTFLGSANYNYQNRRNNYRTLIRDNYTGEAFKLIDNTSGDVRYEGPTFNFMYSFNPIGKLQVGASVNYKIENGLKKVFTYAETIYRNVGGVVGLAYPINENLSFGLTYEYKDLQESIVAADVNNTSVETYHYRGDKYRIYLVGSSQEYKIKKKQHNPGLQLNWKTFECLDIGLTYNYKTYNSSYLYSSKAGIVEDEDGYSDFENHEVALGIQFRPINNMVVGLKGEYVSIDSWSRNTPKDLLLWEWETKYITAGAGVSYTFDKPEITIGLEYELNNIDSDSSKYVDDQFNSFKKNNHLFKAGCEVGLFDQLKVRAGFNYYKLEYDPIHGGYDSQISDYTFGIGYRIANSVEIDSWASYSDAHLKDNNDIKRNYWSANITLRFFTF